MRYYIRWKTFGQVILNYLMFSCFFGNEYFGFQLHSDGYGQLLLTNTVSAYDKEVLIQTPRSIV